MKKKSLLLVSLIMLTSTLVGCNNENTSVDISSAISEMIENKESLKLAIEKARESVIFEGSLTSIYVEDADNYNEGNVEITIGSDFYNWKKTYSDFNGDSIEFDYPFIKNNEGKMAYDHLNIKNKVERTTYVNPGLKTSLNYDDYCLNPFSLFDENDLHLIEDRYYLDSSKLSAFKGMIDLSSSTRYKTYLFDIATVSFSLSNNKFSDVIVTTLPCSDGLLDPKDFFYDCAFDLSYPGKITLPEVKVKTHREEHDILDAALTKLEEIVKGGNYTVHATEEESGGEFGAEYDTYATADGFYSDFKPLLLNYKQGYEKHDDGYYYGYYHYVSGDKVGQKQYMSDKYSSYRYSREELDLNFKTFASEFFIKSGSSFVCSNSSVVDEISKFIAPFIDRHDPFLIASKIFFDLDTNNEITKFGYVARDYASGYQDTFTYSLINVGSTVLPLAA